ncbi:MAG: DNA gyrase subunit A [Planctomycetes bacterium]|nr:DNA gyrase subunit A [Planctomycetota bacterium]
MSERDMAENEETGFGAGEKVRELDIQDELKESYLTYSMSVIIQRALPDIRDGLKPSQRRILVAMRDLNLGPRGAHRKSAAIVGQTMMSYHPHGDGAIYPTLVRMAQNFNTRYPLVDSQGNFGSIDGDPPAAMRYTEARMTEGTVQLMTDIDKETVDHQKTFDNRLDEPSVLPAAFPNLLCNGSTGIAVGMATSMPPHNLGEVCSGLRALIANPDITVEELMGHIPGPDFPTGAEICGRAGIRQAYKTGRGLIKVRSKYHVEPGKNKDSIIFTEIPYQENKVSIIEKISECVKDGRIQDIADVRDESDKNIRLVIELKMSASPEVVVNQLYKFTQLSATFSIINIALVRGRPETLGLKELLNEYKRHRVEIIRRRTRYLLRKAEERAHIVEGLLKALDIIDEVIALIRSSKTDQEAQSRLMAEHQFTEIQAHQILIMQLRRLTGLERQKLQDELGQLHADIKYYREILASEQLVFDLIIEELGEAEKKLGDERRTEIVEEAEDYAAEDLIPEEQVAVTFTREGYVKRTPLSTYRNQGRGGRGVAGGNKKEGDFVKTLFVASTHDYILLYTNKGRVYWLRGYAIPNMGRTAKGRPIINFLNLAEGETVSQQLCVDEFDAERFVVFATRQGTTKKVSLDQFSRPRTAGIIAIKLKEGDSLIGAALCKAGQEVVLGTRAGKAIRFDEADIRPMGRTAAGVGGINLSADDEVVDMAILDPTQEGVTLLTACANGFGKKTAAENYRRQKRNGAGIISIKATARNGPVVGLKAVREDDDIVLMSREGLLMRTQASEISVMGRSTQGVNLMRLQDGDTLAAIECVAPAEAEENEADAEATEATDTEEAGSTEGEEPTSTE